MDVCFLVFYGGNLIVICCKFVCAFLLIAKSLERGGMQGKGKSRRGILKLGRMGTMASLKKITNSTRQLYVGVGGVHTRWVQRDNYKARNTVTCMGGEVGMK